MGDEETGFDCCASFSGKLMLDFVSDCPNTCCFGGRISFTCGMLPAMDVSGMLAFRGGGGGGSKLEGLYAVLV